MRVAAASVSSHPCAEEKGAAAGGGVDEVGGVEEQRRRERQPEGWRRAEEGATVGGWRNGASGGHRRGLGKIVEWGSGD